MTRKQTRSVRARRAEYRAQKKRRRTYIALGIVGALIAVAAFVAVALQRQAVTPDDVVLPETLEAPLNADGKAWGAPDAPVVVEEFGDFQ